MKILGIETSCDETAAAIIDGNGNKARVISNIISSQIEIHKKYGGVVPEVAAREHVLNILPVVHEALEKAGIKKEEVRKKIDAITVTAGPGLITSLIVGVETAKALSFAWNIPLVAVNHIEGHIYANFINNSNNAVTEKFPAIILTVSGGHTMLILAHGHGKYKVIGDTRDDAAGEAFDKAAQLLGLGYPGGPAIAKQAEKYIKSKKNNIKLPRPMINSKDFDFSFSGLKTALLYQINKDKEWKNRKTEYAVEFQQAVIDVLIEKTIKSAENYHVNNILLSGGVSANQELREQLQKKVIAAGKNFYLPDFEYCTDNAAMIAVAGYYKLKRSKNIHWSELAVNSNLILK